MSECEKTQENEILEPNCEQTQNEQICEEKNEFKDKFEALELEFKDLKDKYLRANAEFENIKKRLEKEKINALSYANESFAKDLLDVLDALEAALKSEANDEVSAKIKEGVQNTLNLFLKKLEKNGISQIEENDKFDPNLHEALAIVESQEHEKDQIVQLIQKGYKIKERLLRSSKVIIAK